MRSTALTTRECLCHKSERAGKIPFSFAQDKPALQEAKSTDMVRLRSPQGSVCATKTGVTSGGGG
jgi:hypothetical protein